MVSNPGLRASLLLWALTFLLAEQLVDASKIAYKKPLYGKLSHFKDRRLKQRTTSSPTLVSTQEADWPAPIEFIINSSTAKAVTKEEQPESISTSSSTSSSSSTSTSPSNGSSTPSPQQETLEQDELQQETDWGNSSTTSTPSSPDNTLPSPPTPNALDAQQPVPCTCGVFLTSQIKNGLPEAPLIHNEMDRMYPCNAIGRKQCQTKCLETIVQHLPNSANIVCAALGHQLSQGARFLVYQELSECVGKYESQAGREYCCKEGQPYRCPLLG